MQWETNARTEEKICKGLMFFYRQGPQKKWVPFPNGTLTQYEDSGISSFER